MAGLHPWGIGDRAAMAAAWPIHLLQDWRAAIQTSCVRRWGRHSMDAGIIAAFPAACLPLPFKYAALGLVVLGAVLARPPVNRLPGFWWAASAATLALATTWVQPHPADSDALPLVWVLAWLAAPVLVDRDRRRWALMAGIGGLCLAVGLALAQALAGHSVDAKPWFLATWGERFGRTGGLHEPVSAGNLLVGVLVWLLPSAAVLGVADTFRGRFWQWRGIVALGLVLAQVRMGLLAGLVAVGSWWASGGRRRLLVTVVAAPVALAALLALLAIVDPERFHRTLAFEDGRWPIWRTGLSIIAHNPWFGVGAGDGLQAAYRAAFAEGGASEFGTGYLTLHNSYLTIAAQHGIPALLVWLGALVAPVIALWRRAAGSDGARLALTVVAAMLTLACFDHLFGRTGYVYPLWLGLGLALAFGDRGAEANDA